MNTQNDLILESRLTRLETNQENTTVVLNEIKQTLRDLKSENSAHFRWLIAIIFTIMGSPFVIDLVKAVQHKLGS